MSGVAVNGVRKDRAAPYRKELAINATPETIRHRQVSVVDELLFDGRLGEEQRRAAMEIATVYMAIVAGLHIKVQNFEQRIAGGSHQDWRAGMISAYHDRYIPWRQEAGAIPASRRSATTVAQLVLMMAVDNYGTHQVERIVRIDKKTVLNQVRVSLLRYAEIGGWVDVCGRSQIAS